MYMEKIVLIVDDSPVHRHMLREIVAPLGFKIFEAENGLLGVEMAQELHPHLILMDVVMPGINGFQATRQIKLNETLKDIPVIMCTSKNDEPDRIWGKRQGASAYLTKPIDKDLLIKEIEKLVK